MINSIIKALMNWMVASVVIPISAWIIDYFLIKKENKELKIAVKALKDARTIQEKIDASNNMP